MFRTLLVLGAALLIGIGARPAAAADVAIGSVTRIQGEATWRAGQSNEPLFPGAPVFSNQRVSTGEASRLELTFDDGTAVTLGEKAELTLDSFVYDPAAGNGELKATIVGAFRFVSGQVSKQPQGEVTVATRLATIGIRGTDFWGGPIDDQSLGVLLFEGAVSVTNAAGEQTLSAPGEGTNIAAPGDAPGAITTWPEDKVARAIATITFQ